MALVLPGVTPPRRDGVRAVLFDFDGVLTPDASGSLTTLRELERSTGVPAPTLWDALAPFNQDLLLGRTTHAAVWPAVCERLGRALPFEALVDAFRATPIDAAMLDLARSLRRHARVGLVTDNKRDRIDILVRLHALDATFDPIVVSADIGSDKSTAAIFEHALRRLGVAPHETVFIDNTPANLVAPRALGLHTVHFDDARRDIGALAGTLEARFGLAAGALSPANA